MKAKFDGLSDTNEWLREQTKTNRIKTMDEKLKKRKTDKIRLFWEPNVFFQQE
jgi:hypothetical protein